MTPEKLASMIDHTKLGTQVIREQVEQLCDEAIQYKFCSVCVNPRWTSFAAEKLASSNVKVCSVLAFPHGTETTATRVAAAIDLIAAGAHELDMVVDLAAIAERDEDYLCEQFRSVLNVCRIGGSKVALKLIIESAALSDEEIVFICRLADICGIDFVKTSTGLHSAGGATVEDVRLMKESAPSCKVKAAGGIRILETAIQMIQAGAERIGTSSAVQIVEELNTKQS